MKCWVCGPTVANTNGNGDLVRVENGSVKDNWWKLSVGLFVCQLHPILHLGQSLCTTSSTASGFKNGNVGTSILVRYILHTRDDRLSVWWALLGTRPGHPRVGWSYLPTFCLGLPVEGHSVSDQRWLFAQPPALLFFPPFFLALFPAPSRLDLRPRPVVRGSPASGADGETEGERARCGCGCRKRDDRRSTEKFLDRRESSQSVQFNRTACPVNTSPD